jgi:hypothetical protein
MATPPVETAAGLPLGLLGALCQRILPAPLLEVFRCPCPNGTSSHMLMPPIVTLAASDEHTMHTAVA